MSPDPRALVRPAAPERERVAQTLCEHFASDHLSMDELDDRLARVYRAETIEQLEGLLAGLPPLPVADAQPASVPVPASGEEPIVSAVLSSNERRGSWVVPARLRVKAVLGNVELDLREATLTAPVTEITVRAVLGNVELTVPPGVRVEILGSAFLANFGTDGAPSPVPAAPGQPVVRVLGRAVLGNVEAHTRPPRDSGRALPGGSAARLGRGPGGG